LWLQWACFIFGIDTYFCYAGLEARIIRRSLPCLIEQLHLAKFLDYDKAPVWRNHLLQSTAAIARVLIAAHATVWIFALVAPIGFPASLCRRELAHVRAHHFIGRSHIASTSFIGRQQVSSLLHSAKIQAPDTEPLCLVVMSGKFAFSGPPGRTQTFPFAIEVFDARTGNLLQSGGSSQLPQSTTR